MGVGMMRLFVALGLPSALRTRLSFLAGGLPGVRWVPPENYHLTLRFIGEMPGWRAEEVDDALDKIRAPGLSLQLNGVGTFAKAGRITTLYIGVERNPALDHLQSKVERALQHAGLNPDRARFIPHVTMARLGARLGSQRGDPTPEAKVAAWVQSHNLFRSTPVPVEHFTLFSSMLGKEQAVYCPEVEYELTGNLPARTAQESLPGQT
jgi:2'-5' RNA ligase